MFEISSNISKIDTKLLSYNNQGSLLQEAIKENLQLLRPKYSLVYKKK
jgi:adenine-specific DNA methylase